MVVSATAHAYTDAAVRHAIDNGVKGIEHGNLISRDTAELCAIGTIGCPYRYLLTSCRQTQDGVERSIPHPNAVMLWHHDSTSVAGLPPAGREGQERASDGSRLGRFEDRR